MIYLINNNIKVLKTIIKYLTYFKIHFKCIKIINYLIKMNLYYYKIKKDLRYINLKLIVKAF